MPKHYLPHPTSWLLKSMAVSAMMFFSVFAFSQTYLLRDDNASSGAYEDANNLIGIGTSAPAGKLHVRGSSYSDAIITSDYYTGINPAPDYFLAQHFSIGPPPGFAETRTTDFVIKGNGNVGIGTAEPEGLLHIKANASNPSPGDFGPPVMGIVDENGEPIFFLMNNGDGSSTHGASLLIRGEPNGDIPSLAVFNMEDWIAPFGVNANGTVALGFDISASSTVEAEAQLDIRGNNPYDNIVNVATGANDPLFKITNNGNIGIGFNPTSTSATLTLLDGDADTRIDLYAYGSRNKAIRFMSSNTAQARHVITEDDGDLVIDPGISGGGGNNKLRIDGVVQIGGESITTGAHGDALFFVDGKIAAKACVVTINNWSDKVFEKDYNLKPLAEVEEFISVNKHLPDVPPEKEVLQNGISLGEMNATLLQKVEELTLYTIQMQKEVEELKHQITVLKKN